jgi:hypothetical protein
MLARISRRLGPQVNPSRLSALFAPVVLWLALLAIRAPDHEQGSKSASGFILRPFVGAKFGLPELGGAKL